MDRRSLGLAVTVFCLASAAAAQQPAVPAKKRVARVTTCRCGDPSSQQ